MSADGSVLYANASGVFVRPRGMPAPVLLNAMMADGRERVMEKALAATLGADQDVAERRRAAVLDALRISPGSATVVTHLPDFGPQRDLWAQSHPFVRSLSPGKALDAPELDGKVFTCFAERGPECPLVGAVRFSFCAQGPPSTAHGGSRFAVLHHTALTLCRDEVTQRGGLADAVRLEKCEVQLRARLPMDVTVKAEMTIVHAEALAVEGSRPVAWRFTLRGYLSDIDGQTVYDTAEIVGISVANDATVLSNARAILLQHPIDELQLGVTVASRL